MKKMIQTVITLSGVVIGAYFCGYKMFWLGITNGVSLLGIVKAMFAPLAFYVIVYLSGMLGLFITGDKQSLEKITQ